MKKQHLIIILLFSFLLAVPAVQAQKKVLPAELEVEPKIRKQSQWQSQLQ